MRELWEAWVWRWSARLEWWMNDPQDSEGSCQVLGVRCQVSGAGYWVSDQIEGGGSSQLQLNLFPRHIQLHNPKLSNLAGSGPFGLGLVDRTTGLPLRLQHRTQRG